MGLNMQWTENKYEKITWIIWTRWLLRYATLRVFMEKIFKKFLQKIYNIISKKKSKKNFQT
jgi:hypothetical protein